MDIIVEKNIKHVSKVLDNMKIKFVIKDTANYRLILIDTVQLIDSMQLQVIFENALRYHLKMFIVDNKITIYNG